jgi:hypothetical protein
LQMTCSRPGGRPASGRPRRTSPAPGRAGRPRARAASGAARRASASRPSSSACRTARARTSRGCCRGTSARLRVGDRPRCPSRGAELRAAALRTASPSSPSWSEKNCHGVRAPHSSPIQSIGVYGEVMHERAPTLSRPSDSVADRRSPVARLPTWSWSCR